MLDSDEQVIPATISNWKWNDGVFTRKQKQKTQNTCTLAGRKIEREELGYGLDNQFHA